MARIIATPSSHGVGRTDTFHYLFCRFANYLAEIVILYAVEKSNKASALSRMKSPIVNRSIQPSRIALTP
jgi:hypothetical protein